MTALRVRARLFSGVLTGWFAARRRQLFGLSATVVMSVVVSLLPVVPAHAAVVSMDRGSGPSARSVPVGGGKARPAKRSQTDGLV